MVEERPAYGAFLRVNVPRKREVILVVELVRLLMRRALLREVGTVTAVVGWVEKVWVKES